MLYAKTKAWWIPTPNQVEYQRLTTGVLFAIWLKWQLYNVHETSLRAYLCCTCEGCGIKFEPNRRQYEKWIPTPGLGWCNHTGDFWKKCQNPWTLEWEDAGYDPPTPPDPGRI